MVLGFEIPKWPKKAANDLNFKFWRHFFGSKKNLDKDKLLVLSKYADDAPMKNGAKKMKSLSKNFGLRLN